MSVLHVGHVQAAIEKRFKNLIDLSDVKESHRPDCFLTRGLSAFVVAELSGAEDPIAAAAVLDCPTDNGIDAIYFDAVDLVCYVVQSKWIKSGNGSVDVGSVLKFKQGIHDFFQGDFEQFGPKMAKIRPAMEEVLADSRVIFKLVVAYTGQQPLSPDAEAPLLAVLNALNDPAELVSLKVLAQGDLWGIVAKQALAETVDLQIMLKEFGTVREPYLAYYGQVDLKDIATWGKYGPHLYAKNIRGFKGSTDVNEGIIGTIKLAPQNFWYFNNGITVVCDKAKPQPLGSGAQESRVFECEGASVVNGAQTVGSIVAAVNGGTNGLQNARVLVRIISLENCPETFGLELTKAANTQNRIESKDFVAQDPQQARLQTELYLEKNKRYVYRSGDAPPLPEQGCSFEEAAVALACAHPDIAYCVQAKREVGKLWEDITKAPYTVLFNSSTSSIKLWRLVEIMRIVDGLLKTLHSVQGGKVKLVATHGNRFILYIVCRSLPNLYDEQQPPASQAIAGYVASTLAELLDAKRKLFESSYPSNFFKNAGKCKEIAATILEANT
jgi:AIPR protein